MITNPSNEDLGGLENAKAGSQSVVTKSITSVLRSYYGFATAPVVRELEKILLKPPKPASNYVVVSLDTSRWGDKEVIEHLYGQFSADNNWVWMHDDDRLEIVAKWERDATPEEIKFLLEADTSVTTATSSDDEPKKGVA